MKALHCDGRLPTQTLSLKCLGKPPPYIRIISFALLYFRWGAGAPQQQQGTRGFVGDHLAGTGFGHVPQNQKEISYCHDPAGPNAARQIYWITHTHHVGEDVCV